MYPSITSWWALAMSFKLFVWLNCSEISCSNQVTRMFYSKIRMNDTSQYLFICNRQVRVVTWPKVYPAPLGDMPQPQRSSGSDHKRSHMGPSWGTSCTRSKFRMLSRFSTEGDKPPCRQNISDST